MKEKLESQNQDSIQVSKSSVGYGYVVKAYRKPTEKYQDVIIRLKKVFNQLEKEFPNQVQEVKK